MIGTGPANTIGAWVTNRKPVLWYTGDGSFGFYAMEMDTMARLGIPVVCVISNDSAWGMIRLEQKYTWEKEVEERGQSVLIKKGHRIRLGIAGHDKGTFARIPESQAPAISVARNSVHASHIDLPVAKRHQHCVRSARASEERVKRPIQVNCSVTLIPRRRSCSTKGRAGTCVSTPAAPRGVFPLAIISATMAALQPVQHSMAVKPVTSSK